ncbi:hypothetical protein [Pseudoalteromonas sp. PS5]|uniref:hypothetical protein n=1 Tax=Pseudoalteromonas sp. PS5 TaxID=1437473 RepID=UPI000FFF1C65|nr:hypothetical protein [Pseudoalteromonas sp. PS5]RXE95561.1 hypothetical protein D9603_20110 [Pseudoalteromonas sp. PS5]
MSQQVEIQLTGMALVQVTKTVTVSQEQSKALLADDGAMKHLLASAVNAPVKAWDNVFGKRELIETIEPTGVRCLTTHCGWVGEGVSVCPKCQGQRFHKFQSIQPR